MKNILFLIPYNQSAIYIESIAEELAKTQNIILLTFESAGAIHENFKKFGVKEAYGLNVSNSSPVKKLINLIRLIIFCRKHEIDLVYSHYQEANLLAVFLQYFIYAKVFVTRHHSDCAYLDSNFKEKLSDKIINNYSRHYIVPSLKVYEQMINVEKIKNTEKIEKINYGYNYSKLLTKRLGKTITANGEKNFVILSSARFIPEKRHNLIIEIFYKFQETHPNTKLILLGKGPTKYAIKERVNKYNLMKKVSFKGFITEPFDYYRDADVFLHLSISEASNSAVKEVGIMKTPVIVCSNVGDFSDYFIDGINGFLVDREYPEERVLEVLDKLYHKQIDGNCIGINLRKTIIEIFDIELVSKRYLKHVQEL